MAKIVICSGGTGGHMFPACALFELLKVAKHQVSILTDTRGEVFCKNIEEKIVLNTVRFSLKKLHIAISNLLCTSLRVLKIWKHNNPDIIIGFGGLFTIIPILIAKMLGTKVIIYEQNAIIGKANKLLSIIADLKLATFIDNGKWTKITAQVRKEFINAANISYKCDDKIKIIIIGGSQGAVSFATIIPGALSLLDKEQRNNIEILQQVSAKQLEALRQTYQHINIKARLVTFIYDIANEMASSQLVICRAGASTLAELSTLGKPAILIPYPHASENHQFFNALYYKNKNAAWIIEESEEASRNLSILLQKILTDRKQLQITAANMLDKTIVNSPNTFLRLIEQTYQSK